MRRALAAAASAAWASAAAAMVCPGSKSFVHAKCQVRAQARAPCADVAEEMAARVGGQRSQQWHDPHNNGLYAIEESSANRLLVTRTSGSRSVGGKTYTDKVVFSFEEAADGGSCSIAACSESQGLSISDFSTNYCNIRNLYCGSANGCSAVKHDFATEESEVQPSFGAGTDASACVVAQARAARSLMEREVDDIGGFYTDPNHYKQGTYAGTRMISQRIGDTLSKHITLVGSDDGVAFWTLTGKFTSSEGALAIDFSPKGGPADLNATYSKGKITFSDGNAWTRMTSSSTVRL